MINVRTMIASGVKGLTGQKPEGNFCVDRDVRTIYLKSVPFTVCK